MDSKSGPAINEIVLKKFEGLLIDERSKDAAESLKEKLLTPENSKTLVVPKVNSEIWNSLSQKTRSGDLRLQLLQRNVLKGIIGMAYASDEFLKADKCLDNNFAKCALDNIMLASESMAQVFLDISANRRAEIKPSLDSQYTGICGTQAHGEFLFGANIVESLKAYKSVEQQYTPHHCSDVEDGVH